MIGLFAPSATGRRAAASLAARLGPEAVLADGPIGPTLRRLWPQLDSAVFFLGAGATVRLVAPLLRDPHTDPGIVSVDESGRFAVALVGEHSGGANALAEQVGDVLGCLPVVTSAADSAGSTPLDEIVDLLDATVDGDLASCGAAILAGSPVRLLDPHGFPLPALPDNVASDQHEPLWTVVIDDRRVRQEDPERTVRLIPRTIVVGVGSARDVSRTEVTEVMARLDSEHGLDPRAIRAFATVEAKADEPGILDATQDMGFWHSPEAGDEMPLLHYSAEVLASVDVPNPSPVVLAEAGTASVAEAAAVHAATELGNGARAELVVPKVKGTNVTVAAARVRPRGRLAIVGIGPGAADLRTPRADAELRRAATVVGAEEHVEQVRHVLRLGTEVHVSAGEAGQERAVSLAASGHAVALIGSDEGDATVALALERVAADIELVRVPSVPPSAR